MAEYSDPYEAWKQGGRKGPAPGSTDFPAAPTNAPAAPAPTPSGVTGRGGAPAPAPAPSGGGSNPAATAYFNSLTPAQQQAARATGAAPGGVNFDQWFKNAVNAGAVRGGSAQGPSATQSQSTGDNPLLPEGASGYNAADPTAFRKIDPKILQGMTPEQRAVWSMENIDDLSAHGDADRAKAQWMEWQKSYDPNCPPSDPYQAEDGSGCVEKPDNSNKGYQAAAAAGGGGGGQGGGAAAPAGGGGAGAGAGSDLSNQLESVIKNALSGESSRYNDKAMQGLLAAIKQRIETSKGHQLRQAEGEAAARGMSRSGRTGTNLAAIRRGAEAGFTSEYAGVLKAKIDADRQDKLDAIDRAQKHLDSLRDELYRRDMSAIQRQQFQANLDLAYANLANQKAQFASSQQYGKDMLAAQYGYANTFGGL